MEKVETQKILIIDDDQADRQSMIDIFLDNHEVLAVESGEQAINMLALNQDIDLILLDVRMAGSDGYRVLKTIKNDASKRHIPVILLDSETTTAEEEKGLKLGAIDYIFKPYHPGIARLRVENHLSFVRQRKMLENLAGIDGLTEIPNRRNFEEALIKEWQSMGESRRPLSLAILDVDFFKQYNDHYGHAKGDKTLRAIASVLQFSMRSPAERAARYGGEEFVLLFPKTDGYSLQAKISPLRAPWTRLPWPGESGGHSGCSPFAPR